MLSIVDEFMFSKQKRSKCAHLVIPKIPETTTLSIEGKVIKQMTLQTLQT